MRNAKFNTFRSSAPKPSVRKAFTESTTPVTASTPPRILLLSIRSAGDLAPWTAASAGRSGASSMSV